MATALYMINRAYSKIGVRAAETALSASETSDALDVLNDMLASWDAVGTLKGVAPVMNTTDELNVPRHSHWAIKANLAILLAGEFGIAVSQAMATDATMSKNALISASMDLRNIKYPSTLPIGSGNQDEFGKGYDREFFPENDKTNF